MILISYELLKNNLKQYFQVMQVNLSQFSGKIKANTETKVLCNIKVTVTHSVASENSVIAEVIHDHNDKSSI